MLSLDDFLGIGIFTEQFSGGGGGNDSRFSNSSRSFSCGSRFFRRLGFGSCFSSSHRLHFFFFLRRGRFLFFFGHNKNYYLVDTSLGVRVALHADRLARPLACASVGLGALTTHRQAAHVADTTVALDALQALQVHAQFTT